MSYNIATSNNFTFLLVNLIFSKPKMTAFSSLTDGNLAEKIIPAVVAATSGVIAYLVLNAIYHKTRGSGNPDSINKSIEKDKAKVAHSFDIEDLPDKVAFCRCWKSKKASFKASVVCLEKFLQMSCCRP